VIACGVTCAKVAKPCEVEWLRTRHDSVATAPFQARQQAQGMGTGAPIVDEHNFKAPITRRPQTAKQILEQAGLISKWNNNANFTGGRFRDVCDLFGQESTRRPFRADWTQPTLQGTQPCEDSPGARRLDVMQFRLQALCPIPFLPQ